MSPGCFQVAFVHILQQEEDYRDGESLINRALQIAISDVGAQAAEQVITH
jgi:hypothetical protein